MVRLSRRFDRLTPFRVREVLLVSSPYDHYVMAEDGHLTQLMTKEFSQMNLSHAPRISHAEDADEALGLMQRWKFELVITMGSVGDDSVEEFGRAVKELLPDCEVVLLAHSMRELASIHTGDGIDRIFVWSGNSRLLIAIIKLVEDARNIAHDTRIASIPVLLLVEDSRRFYSTYLSHLYQELVRQTRTILDEGLNLYERLLRLRARTKVLHATTMEEAVAAVDLYGQNLIGLITDAGFPAQNRKDMQAGLSLIARVRERFPDLPILMQSTDKKNETPALALGASFLHKHDPALLKNMDDFLRKDLGFGEFVFRMPDGTELDTASTLQELATKLRQVPAESVEHHAVHNQFSHWLRTRAEFDLADRIRPMIIDDFDSVEDTREFLASTFEKYLISTRRSGVMEFAGRFDSGSKFQRYGSGSLGGKGRGLAFFSTQLDQLQLDTRHPDVLIDVPPTVVLATGIFEDFVHQNELGYLATTDVEDEEVASAFLAGSFSEEIESRIHHLATAMDTPLAVRSSSRLEDALPQPFAGVYSTYFLANDHPEPSLKAEQLLNTIKLVYASTYSQNAKAFVRATQNSIEEESMAVVIQPLIGSQHGDRYYPTAAGVARSFNYYPVGPMVPTEGIAAVALGLGKTVAGGERCVRFSPHRPKRIYQFSSVDATLRSAQREFWALEMRQSEDLPLPDPEYNLLKLDLDAAEADGQLAQLASTWDSANDRIWDGIGREGVRLVTMSGVLKRDVFPLCEILKGLLKTCEELIGCPVEIEFAMVLDEERQRREFHLLQLRPLVSESTEVEVEFDDSVLGDALAHSSVSLGNGVIDDVTDIIYVHPARLDRMKSIKTAYSIARFNAKLIAEGRSYLLIGPGRWGSADHMLGIPVKWAQISAARTIIECELEDISVDASQGTHFFQNIVSFNVGYLTIRDGPQGEIDWDWLEAVEPLEEVGAVRHLRLSEPLRILLDGRQGRAAIIKPNSK